MKAIVLRAMLSLSDGPIPEADAIAAAIVGRAAAEGLDPLLLVSLAHHESRFQVGKVNAKTKCVGLFQTSPFWVRRVRFVWPASGPRPSQAYLEVATGARVLSLFAARYLKGRTWADVIAAWNQRYTKDPKASAWSRKVCATWAKLQREAKGQT